MPIVFFQVTAAYSNAMLVAVMPYFADFAHKLDLPTPQPVAQQQAVRFNCFPRSDHIGGRLILTNGCEFIFDHGRVENFVSPKSYFYLQNPDLIPHFYGPVKISDSQAVAIAHDAIKKLGYTDATLSADRPPEITRPERDHGSYIARYRVRWFDPARGDPRQPPTSAEFEIDATTGQIVMANIRNPNTYRPDLKITAPTVAIGESARPQPTGVGRKIYPVSQAYSDAFLSAILSQCSEYAKTAGFIMPLPLSVNDIDINSYQCGLVDGDPMASFRLKSGEQLDYRHGQVIAFYSADAMHLPGRASPTTYPEIDRERAKFFGPVNMTSDEAVNLIRQTARRLGYSEHTLHLDETPRMSGPAWWGTNRIARCFVEWRESVDGPTYVNAEVDVGKRMLKSLYVNDHVITNIWRQPPKINVPNH